MSGRECVLYLWREGGVMKTREVIALARQLVVGIWESPLDLMAGRGLDLADAARVVWWAEALSDYPHGWMFVW